MKFYDIVKSVLEDHKLSRDNDLILVWRVYERLDDQIPVKTFGAVCRMQMNKEIPLAETLSRIGRKVKEDNPELRGKDTSKKVEYVQGLMKL